jgi:hypothetical protein
MVVVLLLAGPGLADWDLGDGHKMHFPQLPDPNGWDVDVTTGFVADDWQCSGTGPVDGIHFWISAKGDNWGNGIDFIDVKIYKDVPAGTDPDPAVTWSHPGDELWFSRVQDQGTGDVFTVRQPALEGNEGWYSPMSIPPAWNRPDHVNYWQINIKDIAQPFSQTEGTVYWLELHIIPNPVDPGQDSPMFGWKTSQDHWNDDAAYQDDVGNWQELWDPELQPPVSLDMAFVITPEPMTLLVLVAGVPLLLKRRCRN